VEGFFTAFEGRGIDGTLVAGEETEKSVGDLNNDSTEKTRGKNENIGEE